MGAGVYDAVVRRIDAGQIFAVLIIESELQDLHTGEIRVGEQFPHVLGDEAQILGDDPSPGEFLTHTAEQFQTGRAFPFSVAGRALSVGDGVIAGKTAEVVDTYQIVDGEILLHPIQPPAKAVFLHLFPVVDGIAPQLTVGGESVGGTSRHHGGIVIFIQQELLRRTPYVHAVVSHVDGHIADDQNTLFVGVVAHGTPLLHKGVLDPFPEAALAGKGVHLRACFVDVFVARLPGGPGAIAVVDLQSHKQRIIIEPCGIFAAERRKRAVRCETGVRLPQKIVAGVEQPAVIHTDAVVLYLSRLFFGEKPVPAQQIGIDKVRIARDGGGGLIGAVPVGGGIQGQNLPAFLTARVQEINKIKGAPTKGADTVRGGKAAHRHQNAAFMGEAEVFFATVHNRSPSRGGWEKPLYHTEIIIALPVFGVNRKRSSGGQKFFVFYGHFFDSVVYL